MSVMDMYKTKKCKNTFFHRGVYIYNQLPENIRNLSKINLKKILKEFIRTNFEPKSIPRIPEKT